MSMREMDRFLEDEEKTSTTRYKKNDSFGRAETLQKETAFGSQGSLARTAAIRKLLNACQRSHSLMSHISDLLVSQNRYWANKREGNDMRYIYQMESRLQQYLEERKSLLTQLEEHNAVDSGSYGLNVPTPDVLRKCTRKVYEGLKDSTRHLYEEYAWQAILCRFMFEDFGSADFKVTNCKGFRTPLQLKKDRFTYYVRWRDRRTEELISEDNAFLEFLEIKWSKFVEGIRIKLDREVLRKIESSIDIRETFNQMGQAVWLLHKVAFSCEPANAEIFHVPVGSGFDEDCMVELIDIPPHDSWDASSGRIVALVTVPGFTLRNSIIEAQVCCTDSLLHEY
ncbi:hypothetical protein KP509_10G060200 [Ceratopteris richardii]|uniref:Uncharacterized protein n=1 Tax=Ceratopteris richardii TaxID=49495 RepID=A0A8T2TY01_CERRI|nr:hypothetical protein KP509_10G060200 [Ceratopteris richardii]